MTTPTDDHLERARRLHERALVLDSHCDTVQRLLQPGWDFAERHDWGHVDLPRLREAGVDAVCMAAWAPPDVDAAAGRAAVHTQIDAIEALCAAHPQDLALAHRPADVLTARAAGRVALLPAVEGGHLIGNSLETLREFAARGIAYLTLTHAVHTDWADSSGVYEPVAPKHGGLTDFGRDVVATAQHLGVLVDVTHVSDATFWHVLEVAQAPVVASHSSCRAVADQIRNLTDEMIRSLAQHAGVVHINFNACFVDADAVPAGREESDRAWHDRDTALQIQARTHTPLSRLVDHVDHALQLVGPEHVGLGSDFDGVVQLPTGMEDCTGLPRLTAALLARGYDEAALAPGLGGNFLRLWNDARRWAGPGRHGPADRR